MVNTVWVLFVTRRDLVILATMILVVAIGFAGYQAWQETNPGQSSEQTTSEEMGTLSCSNCSFIKKDLAEKVRLREQQSKEIN